MKNNLKNVGFFERRSRADLFNSGEKAYRHRFGRYSILAAIPAFFFPNIPKAHFDNAKTADANITDKLGTLYGRPNVRAGTLGFLKWQTSFWLPHQKTSFSLMAAFTGNDDCPGRAIPGGEYTADAPYIDSGDTTGANDTVYGFAYIGYDAAGPDLIYSFTLKDRGPNPQIEVSTSSNTFQPIIYISKDEFLGGCPAGTGNGLARVLAWGGNTLDRSQMANIPLNVPLYLFVDSARSDSFGPYTLRIQDVTVAPQSCQTANPIDCTDFLVRQHYRDFLHREADTSGLTFWNNQIDSCAGDPQCIEVKRINVSASFFLSIEFQRTGYLVYKTYAAALGPTRTAATVPLTRSEFISDAQRVGQGVIVGVTGWEAQLEANQVAYFNEFVQRPDFQATYPSTMSPFTFVDTLNANAGNALTMPERDQLALELMAGTKTRAQVLRAVVENEQFSATQFNRAFVLMEYFGYLRRNPNDAPDNNFDGYNFWLAKLNHFNGDYIEAEMVKAFLTSLEYRQRFLN